jgi:hypothetical protein
MNFFEGALKKFIDTVDLTSHRFFQETTRTGTFKFKFSKLAASSLRTPFLAPETKRNDKRGCW